MKGLKKNSDTFYITHSGELLIWLIVILFVTSISTIFFISKQNTDNDYTIFMNDVDGLIVGSPVRMMGIEVGHVTKIKPTNEEVYVKFILTDNKMTIPQGTTATVEFNGMAGSKSLELYLPDKNTYIDKNIPILTVTPPKRLHDAAGLLSDMFDKLSSIIYTSSSFSKKIQFMDLPFEGEENLGKFIKYADIMIDNSSIKVNNLNKKLIEYNNKRELEKNELD